MTRALTGVVQHRAVDVVELVEEGRRPRRRRAASGGPPPKNSRSRRRCCRAPCRRRSSPRRRAPARGRKISPRPQRSSRARLVSGPSTTAGAGIRKQSACSRRDSCQAKSAGLYCSTLAMPPSIETTVRPGSGRSSMALSAQISVRPQPTADPHAGPQHVGQGAAGGGADRQGRVGGRRRQRRHHGLADAEAPLQRALERRQFGDVAAQRNTDLVQRLSVRQEPHDGDAADAERFRDGALGHLLDVVQSRRPAAAAAATGGRTAAFPSVGVAAGSPLLFLAMIEVLARRPGRHNDPFSAATARAGATRVRRPRRGCPGKHRHRRPRSSCGGPRAARRRADRGGRRRGGSWAWDGG